MKKRMITMFLAALFLLPLFSLSARADIIYEPQDTFYNLHREECDRLARNYIADGPNGDVTVYVSPESDKEVKKISNGTEIHISYIYEDDRGILWGYCDFWEENNSGWLPMEYIDLIYDFISFREDHAEEISEEEGSLDEAFSGERIIFCSYPGSDRYTEATAGEYLPEYYQLYVDASGTRWGFCGYYMGHRNGWINLDNPSQVPEAQPDSPETVPNAPEPGTQAEIKPQRNMVLTIGLSAAIAAVVLITAVALKKMKSKS